MNSVDDLELFFLNYHDLIVKVPHPAVTQVVVDTQPTHCVEVVTKRSCGSLVLGPSHVLVPRCVSKRTCVHLGLS